MTHITRLLTSVLAVFLIAAPASAENFKKGSGGGAGLTANSVGAIELDDSECADGEIWKKATGSWACGTDSGAGGGEANTLGSPDVGGEINVINSVPKTGVVLNLRSLEADDFNVALNIISIDDAMWAKDSELHALVTLSGTPDYITLSGQDIIRGQIDLGADITGLLPETSIDDGAAPATEALFSGGAGATGFRAIADADVPDTITIDLATLASTVTTNANLTGPITSTGNATAITAQTGTGTTFVMQASPTLTTPVLTAPALGTPASGVMTNVTGTAAGLTAGSVTTNANLTGPITSTGNATAVASQTGTGTTFVMNTSPTLITPVLGAATATSYSGVLAANLLDKTATEAITGDYDFGAGGIEVENSITVPGSCTVGQLFMDTDATSGQRLFGCEGGIFVLQGDGGASGGDDITVQSAFGDPVNPIFNDTATIAVTATDAATDTVTWAVIDAAVNHDALLNFDAAEHFTQAAITTTGTITSGVWTGTTIAVANGGTGLTAGTSGGILGYTATGTLASSGALGAGNILVGGGAGATPTSVAAGATNQILVGGGAGTAPAWTTATGSGAPVRATSPVLVTPTLGVATATSYDGIAAANLLDKSAGEVITGDWDFGGGGIEVENGITPPACTVGQLYVDTDATSGQQLMACEAGTFVQQGGAGGASVWTDTGTVVHPAGLTDDVSLGSATLVNASKFSIDGDADQVQVTIQAFSTQTDSILIVETSAGVEIINLDASGDIKAQSIQDTDGPGTNWSIDASGDAILNSLTLGGSAAPAWDFNDTDDAGTIDGSININCPTANDCDMDFAVNSGADTQIVNFRIDTETGGATNIQMGGNTTVGANPTNFVQVGEGGLLTFQGSATIQLPNGAAPTTDAAGELALDTTIIDHQPLLQYFDGGENMSVIAIDTAQLPALDNEIFVYDSASDKFLLETNIPSLLPVQATSCAAVTTDGEPCWESDAEIFWIGDGAAPLEIFGASSLIPVANGGTGAATFTNGGVLFGSGTGAISASAVLTEGQLLIGDGTTDPAVAAMSGDATIASSGALTLDPTLNLLTSGTIRGQVDIVTTTGSTDSPTADEMRGTFHVADNVTPTANVVYTLPTAVAGYSACFYDNGGGSGGVTIDANTGDIIQLNGVNLDPGDSIDSPGAANGDFICLLAIDATHWVTLGSSGTWTDGGP